jgi:hypothetical protein
MAFKLKSESTNGITSGKKTLAACVEAQSFFVVEPWGISVAFGFRKALPLSKVEA